MMLSTHKTPLICCALVAVMALSACGGGGPSKDEQARAEEFAALTEAKAELDAMRLELVDLKMAALAAEAEAEMAQWEADAEPEGEPEGEAEGEAEGEPVETVDLAAQVESLENELASLTDDFGARLVVYLNAVPMIEGEPPTENQLAGLRMKSSEDIVFAKEWIEKGGDYKRAIEMYKNALVLDPGNEEVEAALAFAEANRWMSEERFSQAKRGMMDYEIRTLLGQVIHFNIKPYPEKNAVAWYYPTSEDGSAAVVWFQLDEKTGEHKAYKLDYEAVKAKGSKEEGE